MQNNDEIAQESLIAKAIATKAMIYDLEGLPGIFAYKTVDHEILHCNSLFLQYAGYAHNGKQIIGKTDFDLVWCDYSPIYHGQEDDALKGVQYSAIHPCRDALGRDLLFFNRKFRWKSEEGKVLGVISYSIEIDDPRLLNIGELLNKFSNENDKKYYFLNDERNVSNLTAREKECLFYLLHGKTAKQIAKILNISPRTVQIHLDNVRLKWSCQNKSELIDAAISKGLMSVIPNTLFNPQLSEALEED